MLFSIFGFLIISPLFGSEVRGKHNICIKNCCLGVTFIFQGDIELTLLVSYGVCVLCLDSRPEDLRNIKIIFLSGFHVQFFYMSLILLNLSKVRPLAEEEAPCLPVFPAGFWFVSSRTEETLPASQQPRGTLGRSGRWWAEGFGSAPSLLSKTYLL